MPCPLLPTQPPTRFPARRFPLRSPAISIPVPLKSITFPRISLLNGFPSSMPAPSASIVLSRIRAVKPLGPEEIPIPVPEVESNSSSDRCDLRISMIRSEPGSLYPRLIPIVVNRSSRSSRVISLGEADRAPAARCARLLSQEFRRELGSSSHSPFRRALRCVSVDCQWPGWKSERVSSLRDFLATGYSRRHRSWCRAIPRTPPLSRPPRCRERCCCDRHGRHLHEI